MFAIIVVLAGLLVLGLFSYLVTFSDEEHIRVLGWVFVSIISVVILIIIGSVIIRLIYNARENIIANNALEEREAQEKAATARRVQEARSSQQLPLPVPLPRPAV